MKKRPDDPVPGPRLMRRARVFFIILIPVLLVLLGVTPSLLQADPIKIAWPGKPDTLDPHRSRDPWALTFIEACYQRLVGYQGQTARLMPSAAVTWRISDDRLIYTFVLKKDLTFADGRPLDAAAVSTSFNRAFHVGGDFAVYFPALKGIELIGPYTFRFHLSRPDPSFLTALATGMASIVSPNAVLQPPEYLDDQTLGSGPYQVMKDEHQGGMTLTGRREGPGSKRFEFLFEPDADQRAAMLKQGRVQIAAGIRSRDLDGDRFLIKTYVEPGAGFLAFNMDRPWTGQGEARRALASAVDREALAGTSSGPDLTPAFGYLPAGLRGWLKDTAGPPFDLEQTGQSMVKAGIPNQPLVLAFASHDDFLAQMAQQIKAALTGTGAAVDLQPVDLKENGLPDRDYDLYFGFDRPAVAVPERFWDPLIGRTDNLCRYKNGEVEKKRREASILEISDQRLAVIYDIQRLLDQDLPYLLLFSRRVSYGVDKKIEGFDLHPMQPETIPLSGLKLTTTETTGK